MSDNGSPVTLRQLNDKLDKLRWENRALVAPLYAVLGLKIGVLGFLIGHFF